MENSLKQRTFSRSMVIFVLFLIPTVYLAMIAAVTAHEDIGHGVVTALLGGNFKGFGIRADAMGWANVDVIGLSKFRVALMLAGGSVVTTVMSLIFFALGFLLRKNFFRSATLLVFALAFLCDGIPYFFWDSIYQGMIGDPSGILSLYPIQGMRITWIIAAGLIGIAGIWVFNHSMFTQTLRFSRTTSSNRRREVAVVSLALFAIQSLAWLSFDWGQLIPVADIGILPMIVPIGLTALSLASVAFREWKRPEETKLSAESTGRDGQSVMITRAQLILLWGTVIVVLIAIIGWLQNGILFG